MRSGAGGMTGPLKITDGVVGTPSIAFTSAPTTGLFKSAGGLGLSVNGASVADFNSGVSFVDGGNVASAAALTLGTGNIFSVTGTTAITSIATKGVGTIVWLRFAAALTLTHDATNLVLHSLANIVTRAGDWAVFEEYATGQWKMINYSRADGSALIPTTPRGYLDGCTLSNNTGDLVNDIDVSAGLCRDSTNTVDIAISGLTGKQLDANWAPGSGAGMRNSGAGIANGTYHIWAVRTATSSVGDIYAHTSSVPATVLTALQAETGGSAYAYLRLVGSIVRSGAGSIVAFHQYSDEFWLDTPVLDLNNATPGTSANTLTLSVPAGIKVKAFLNAQQTNGNALYISSLDSNDIAASATLAPLGSIEGSGSAENSGQVTVWTNASSQVRYRVNANIAVRAATLGWRHPRGRDA